jgi:hypothetical protein
MSALDVDKSKGRKCHHPGVLTKVKDAFVNAARRMISLQVDNTRDGPYHAANRKGSAWGLGPGQ